MCKYALVVSQLFDLVLSKCCFHVCLQPVKARFKPYGKLDAGLRDVRAMIDGIDHFLLVSALALLALAVMFTNKMIRGNF